MLKLGMVGGVRAFHGMTFGQLFNGTDTAAAEAAGWRVILNKTLDADARITHVWDPDPEAAAESAAICGIETIVDNPVDMIGNIDGVLIPDDLSMAHQKQAVPFLEAGLPTFIDKPLSPDYEEAAALVETARKNHAPLMSCSALRFAEAGAAVRSGACDLGDIITGFSACTEYGGGMIFYGIHAFEFLHAIVGPGIHSIENAGTDKGDLVIVRYKDGRRFTVAGNPDISHTYQAVIFGTKDNAYLPVKDNDPFYLNMLQQYVRMVETKEEPIPLDETLEIIKSVILAEQSLAQGGIEIAL